MQSGIKETSIKRRLSDIYSRIFQIALPSHQIVCHRIDKFVVDAQTLMKETVGVDVPFKTLTSLAFELSRVNRAQLMLQ